MAGCCRYAREIAQLKTKLAEKDAQLMGGFGSLTNLYLGELMGPAGPHQAAPAAPSGLANPGLIMNNMPLLGTVAAAAGQLGPAFTSSSFLQGAGVMGMDGGGSGPDASSGLASAALGPAGPLGGLGGSRFPGTMQLPQQMLAPLHAAAAGHPQHLMMGGSRIPSAGASNGTNSRLQPAGAVGTAEPATRAGSPKLEPLRGSLTSSSPRYQQQQDQPRPGSGANSILQAGPASQQQQQQQQSVKPGSPLGPLVSQQQQFRTSYGTEGPYSNSSTAANGNFDIGDTDMLTRTATAAAGAAGGGSTSGRPAILLPRGSGSLRGPDETEGPPAGYGRTPAVPDRWQQQQQQQQQIYTRVSGQGLEHEDDEGAC
jgi:hypothetical protein